MRGCEMLRRQREEAKCYDMIRGSHWCDCTTACGSEIGRGGELKRSILSKLVLEYKAGVKH